MFAAYFKVFRISTGSIKTCASSFIYNENFALFSSHEIAVAAVVVVIKGEAMVMVVRTQMVVKDVVNMTIVATKSYF